MTLATVSRYDSAQVSEVGEHAVVIGASMAGLCAARVLADGFDAVTVIERDPLPDEPAARRGVPQAHHPHVLMDAGRATLEDLFPGYSEELLAAGGTLIDGRTDINQYSQGGFLAPATERFALYSATRPLYEQLVRQYVSGIEAIHVRPGCQFVAYLADDAGTTVEGVVIRRSDTVYEELAADLVVDATGRTSRTPAWLEDHGYTPPALDEVSIDVAYSTTFVERPVDDRRAFLVLAEAPRTRGGMAAPVEGGRWVVNLHGVHGDHPPVDPEGFAAFAASLPTPEVRQLLDDHSPVEGISHYPFPSNRRYHYEDLDRFPEGLVVIGDAIASFNPIYGQGMSVAALEAVVLHHTLAGGVHEGVGLRFFDRAARVVDTAWMMAIGADFGFRETAGDKPRGTALFNWYLSRLFRGAHTDGTLTNAFNRVLSMQQPPTSLLRPGVMWRVLKPTS